MKYQVADLIVEMKEVGSLSPYLQDYRYEGNEPADVEITPEKYNPDIYGIPLPYEVLEYLESGRQFFAGLLEHDGFYLHSSSVTYEGRGYLFSANSGTGKSTHTKLWKTTLGENAKVFNDDKTPLRRLDGVWYAYGAPWCGKDNININMKVPVAGICFLKQGPENRIRRLSQQEAVARIIPQTIRRFKKVERLDLLLSHVDKIVRQIPVFELENLPEPDAARLSFETMRKAAEEMGL